MAMHLRASRRGRFLPGLIIIGVLLSTGSLLHADTRLAAELDRFVRDSRWSGVRIGVRVETLGDSPTIIYDHNGRVPRIPASNQKIISTAAALCLLPPDFTYRTILARRGQDLVIIGSGDPSTGDTRMAFHADEPITAVFHRWADALKARNITTIPGDLLYDDTVFDDEYLHPRWRAQQRNLSAWYTAPVGGLNFSTNCLGVVIQRGAQQGAPANVRLVPTTSWTRLSNSATTAANGQPIVNRTGDGPITITVSGRVSQSNSETNPLWVTVPDPSAYFATTARTALSAKGIKVVGQTRRQQVRRPGEPMPDDLEIIAVHETRLVDFLYRMNKRSVNMFSEAVLKTLGAYDRQGRLTAQGTFEGGVQEVNRFLAALGLDPELYVIDDGSGLSRDNRLAPIVLTAVLRYMDRHPLRDLWWESLAEPGDPEGTLRRRMHDLKGKIFAKTGHLSGVGALSGYALGPGGRRYAFSVLCEGGSAHAIQNGICQILATWGANP